MLLPYALFGGMAIVVTSAYAPRPSQRTLDEWRKRHRDNLLTTSDPQTLNDGRWTFLGFRNVKDPLQSSAQPLMPDGGLSPCVIRVLGVGGGGCNAVRTTTGTNHISITTERVHQQVTERVFTHSQVHYLPT